MSIVQIMNNPTPALPPPGAADELRKCRRWSLVLGLLFFLIYLPALPSLSHWRGDERFYTDAAIGMSQSGDYLTPVYADGTLRFKKPILTYWAVVGGIKIFGSNYLGARIAFLAAGSMAVWLAFELCLALFRRPALALAASAIFASNLTVHNTSLRSTPDMLLCLSVMASLLGFVNLLFHERRLLWHALAWLGAAFAIATKGLSGLLPVAYVITFALLVRQPGFRLRSLFHPVFAPLAMAIGGAWFAWVFAQHGDAATKDFFGDQVGNRFSGSKIYILENCGVYIGSFVVELLPWALFALLLLALRFKDHTQLFRDHRRHLQFAGGWLLFLLVVFSFGNIQRTRYFLPAYPFLAAFYGMLLLPALEDSRLNRVAGILFRTLYVVTILCGMMMAIFGAGFASGLFFGGSLLVLSGIVLMTLSDGWSAPRRLAGSAICIMLLFGANAALLSPIFNVSCAPQIVAQFNRDSHMNQPLPMAGMEEDVATQVRLLSAGRLDPQIIKGDACDAALQQSGFLLCTAPLLERLQKAGLTIKPCAKGSRPWKPKDYLGLLRAPDRMKFIESRMTDCYLVTRTSDASKSIPDGLLNHR